MSLLSARNSEAARAKDTLIHVDLNLRLSTRLFSRHEDGCYQQKSAWIKLFAGSKVTGTPAAQLKLDLAQHVGATDFIKEVPFENMTSLKAVLNLSVIKQDNLPASQNTSLIHSHTVCSFLRDENDAPHFSELLSTETASQGMDATPDVIEQESFLSQVTMGGRTV